MLDSLSAFNVLKLPMLKKGTQKSQKSVLLKLEFGEPEVKCCSWLGNTVIGQRPMAKGAISASQAKSFAKPEPLLTHSERNKCKK